MRWMIPDTLVWRSVLVIVSGIGLASLVSIGTQIYLVRDLARQGGMTDMVTRITVVVAALDTTPPAARRQVVQTYRTLGVRTTLDVTTPPPQPGILPPPFGQLRTAIAEGLGNWSEDRIQLRYPGRRFPDGGGQRGPSASVPDTWEDGRQNRRYRGRFWAGRSLRADIALTDGTWVRLRTPYLGPPPVLSFAALPGLLVVILIVTGAAIWAIRKATRPLAVLTGAAERLGQDINATAAVPETGPREVRQAAHAFNRMQTRLRQLVQDRTRMLAAMSHDLRTPITRMRLRSELFDDEVQRKKMLADLAEMETMIAATLAFARDDLAGEKNVRFDLGALVATVCGDFSDQGADVTFHGAHTQVIAGRPVALRRALDNLVGNALKYAGAAEVWLAASAGWIEIMVCDCGPGIPEGRQSEMVRPFVRGDVSRNAETGGTGLGLSVVDGVARTHGGTLTLENRAGGGLKAVICLPVAP